MCISDSAQVSELLGSPSAASPAALQNRYLIICIYIDIYIYIFIERERDR